MTTTEKTGHLPYVWVVMQQKEVDVRVFREPLEYPLAARSYRTKAEAEAAMEKSNTCGTPQLNGLYVERRANRPEFDLV